MLKYVLRQFTELYIHVKAVAKTYNPVYFGRKYFVVCYLPQIFLCLKLKVVGYLTRK